MSDHKLREETEIKIRNKPSIEIIEKLKTNKFFGLTKEIAKQVLLERKEDLSFLAPDALKSSQKTESIIEKNMEQEQQLPKKRTRTVLEKEMIDKIIASYKAGESIYKIRKDNNLTYILVKSTLQKAGELREVEVKEVDQAPGN